MNMPGWAGANYENILSFQARKGLIYFPDFCDIVLERFRETEEEEEDLFGTLFKVCIICINVLIIDHHISPGDLWNRTASN